MDNESEVIQRQMEETRTSLQDKLETLEQQVRNTVENATGAVDNTVENVKDAVQETVETVKDAVQDTVQSVKNSFDVAQHVKNHPWPMFFGAAALGFVATRYLSRTEGLSPPKDSESHEPTRAFLDSSAKPETQSSRPGIASRIADHYRGEIAQVRALAVGTLGALVRDMVLSAAPPALMNHISDVANKLTDSMGGRVIAEPLLKPTPRRPNEAEESMENARARADAESSIHAAGV